MTCFTETWLTCTGAHSALKFEKWCFCSFGMRHFLKVCDYAPFRAQIQIAQRTSCFWWFICVQSDVVYIGLIWNGEGFLLLFRVGGAIRVFCNVLLALRSHRGLAPLHSLDDWQTRVAAGFAWNPRPQVYVTMVPVEYWPPAVVESGEKLMVARRTSPGWAQNVGIAVSIAGTNQIFLRDGMQLGDHRERSNVLLIEKHRNVAKRGCYWKFEVSSKENSCVWIWFIGNGGNGSCPCPGRVAYRSNCWRWIIYNSLL